MASSKQTKPLMLSKFVNINDYNKQKINENHFTYENNNDKFIYTIHSKDNKGIISFEDVYSKCGSRSERDLPSQICFNLSNKIVIYVKFYKGGVEHRDSKIGPQQYTYYYDGTIKEEFYKENGLFHREDGPAKIQKQYDYKLFSKHGKVHRLNGPAIMERNIKTWFINDKKLINTGLPILYRFKTLNNIKLNKNILLKAYFFDREYGDFLRTHYDVIRSYY